MLAPREASLHASALFLRGATGWWSTVPRTDIDQARAEAG